MVYLIRKTVAQLIYKRHKYSPKLLCVGLRELACMVLRYSPKKGDYIVYVNLHATFKSKNSETLKL